MAKTSEFGKAFAAARKRGDKTFEFGGKKYTTQTKEEKDRKVTPEAKKVMDRTRMDRASNMRAQARKVDVEMETPEQRGAANLAGFKRDKEDMSGSGEYSPFKKGGRVNENKMLKRKGRNMTRATMQKEAKKAVRKHEKSMHGMNMGGSVSKRADGIAQRGKTKCKMA